MAISKDQLENFIQTVLEIKNSKRSVIHDSKELKKIAFEMGFTEDDWQEYLKEYQKHLTAGRSFLEHKNPGDAEKHLQKAVTLNPYAMEANALLAETYKQKFLKTRRTSDKERAIEQAEKCLQIDNRHSASYQLISELKQAGHQTPKRLLLIIGAVIVLFMALIALFFTKNEKNPAPIQETYEPENTYQIPNEPKKPDPEIEVIFSDNDKTNGLNFIPDLSELSNYDDSYSYKLQGLIELEGIELEALKLKVEAIDSEGRILFSDYIEPVQSHYQAYRSGDLVPVNFLEYAKDQTNPDLQTVRLSVQTIRKVPAAEQYEESAPVSYTWAYERPANYNVEIRERFKSLSGNNPDNVYYKLTLEAENTGNTAINTLQVEIEWYNKSGEIAESKTAYFTSSSNPKIRRGQTRIYSGTWLIPSSADELGSYEISITDVR